MPAKKAPTKKSKHAVGRTRKPLKAVEPLARRTITIKRETEKAVTDLVGPRKFSAFVQAALDDQLQGKRIDQWLAEQNAEHGPLFGRIVTICRGAANSENPLCRRRYQPRPSSQSQAPAVATDLS